MKKILLFMAMLIQCSYSFSCPVCERNKPKILQGITHGQGPTSNWDYVIIISMIAIALLSFFLSLKWMVRPGEKSAHHIKRTILNIE